MDNRVIYHISGIDPITLLNHDFEANVLIIICFKWILYSNKRRICLVYYIGHHLKQRIMQLFHIVRHHIFSHVNINSIKKLVLLLFVAFISIQISAQEYHFIPRIGFNLANTYPESFADMRPGMNVGVAGEIRFSKLFAIEPGVYYSMQGYHYKYKGQVSKLKIDYLNIPLYAKFYLYRGFHLFAGPQLGINVRVRTYAK